MHAAYFSDDIKRASFFRSAAPDLHLFHRSRLPSSQFFSPLLFPSLASFSQCPWTLKPLAAGIDGKESSVPHSQVNNFLIELLTFTLASICFSFFFYLVVIQRQSSNLPHCFSREKREMEMCGGGNGGGSWTGGWRGANRFNGWLNKLNYNWKSSFHPVHYYWEKKRALQTGQHSPLSSKPLPRSKNI